MVVLGSSFIPTLFGCQRFTLTAVQKHVVSYAKEIGNSHIPLPNADSDNGSIWSDINVVIA